MNEYRNAHASVLKFCNDFARKVRVQDPEATLAPFDFDAVADLETELPLVDLIGPADFGFDVEDGIYRFETMIGITTVDDLNAFRLQDLVSRLFDALKPGMLFPYVDADTGQQVGVFKVMDGTAVMPMARTATRPYKFVAVRVGSDRGLAGPR